MLPGCNADETLEAELLNILNDVRNKCGTACFNMLHSKNSALIMAQCGSKGSNIKTDEKYFSW